MSDYITASFDTLVNQATITVSSYLTNAKNDIDHVFGDGYAENNPSLVAAYIKAAASDLNAAATAKVFGAALQEIARSLAEIASALEEK